MLELIRHDLQNVEDGFLVRNFIKDHAIDFIRVEHLTPIMNEVRKNARMLDVFGDLRTTMRLCHGAPDYTVTLSHRYSYWGFFYMGYRVFVCCSVRGTTFEMLCDDFENAPASVIGEFIKDFYREVAKS